MKRFLVLTILAILGLVFAIPVLASTITTAKYYGVITVSNNGTANTSVSTVFTGNTTAWVANGIMYSSGNNTAIRSSSGADLAYMPGYAGNPWCLWVSSINADTYKTDILYTGGTANMSGKIRYFPGTTGLNIGDPATMEPSSNFTMELSGWYDTSYPSDNQTYVNKQNAIRAINGASGNISAQIYTGAAGWYLSYDGANDYLHKDAAVVSAGAGNTLSIDAWVYKDSSNTDDVILSCGDVAGGNDYYYLSTNAAGVIAFGMNDAVGGAIAQFTSTNTTSNGVWHFITLAYDDARTPEVVLYVDGSIWGGADAAGGGAIATPNTFMGIGERYSGAAWGNPMAGDIDEVRLSDSRRTLAEHQAIYNHGYGYTMYADANTISLWRFNEGSGNPTDKVGNNTLTLAGPTWTQGSALCAQVSASSVSSREYEGKVALDSPFFSGAVNTASDIITPVATYTANNTLVMNTPLWQTECDTSPFTTIDAIGVSATVSGAIWNENIGFTFDGVDDYIQIAHDASQLLTMGGTVGAWIRPNTIGETTGRVFDKSSGTNWNNGFGMYLDTNNRIGFKINAGVPISSAQNAVIFGDGNWYYVAATWDDTGYVTIYVNGSATGTPGISADPVGITTVNAPRIGNRATATDRTFDGQIGEVRLYNVELSATQILQNYNATKSKYTTGNIYTYSTLATVPNNANDWLVGYGGLSLKYMERFLFYKGGVNTCNLTWEYGATFTDESGNGNDGTPSFRLSTADPDISATLSAFLPIAEAKAPAYTLSTAPSFYTNIPGVSGNFTANVSPTYPGHEIITEIAAVAPVPDQLPTMLIFTFILLVISIGMSYAMKTTGVNSLFIKASIITAIMCVYTAMGIYDVWQTYFFAMMALALMWLSRQREAY